MNRREFISLLGRVAARGAGGASIFKMMDVSWPCPLQQMIALPLAFETAPHPLSSVGLEAAILWRVGLHEDA